MPDPQPVISLSLRKEPARCGCLTNSNRQIAVGLASGQVNLIPIDKNLSLIRLKGHTASVNRIASIDSRGIIVSGSSDSTVRLWKEGNVSVIHPECGEITGLSIFPGGNSALIAGTDGAPGIWDLDSCEISTTLQSGAATDASALENICATSMADGKIRIFDCRTGSVSQSFEVASSAISVALSQTRPICAVGSEDGTISLFNLQTNSLMGDCKILEGAVKSLEYHPIDDLLLTSSKDSKVCIFRGRDIDLLYTIPIHPGGANSAKWSEDGSLFVTTGENMGVTVWTEPKEPESEEEVFEDVAPEFNVENQKQTEEESFEEKPPSEYGRKIEILRRIIEKVDDLSDKFERFDKRMETMAKKIKLIEAAQEEDGQIVHSHTDGK